MRFITWIMSRYVEFFQSSQCLIIVQLGQSYAQGTQGHELDSETSNSFVISKTTIHRHFG